MRLIFGIAAALLVVSALSGTLYAPPHGGGGHGGHGGGAGGGGAGGPADTKQDLASVEGVIKTVNRTDEGWVASIVVAGKKNKDGTDGPETTLLIRMTTQVFNGEEPAKPGDLAVGKSVVAAYAKTKDGSDPAAVMIRIVKVADTKKDDPKPAPKDEAKAAPKAPVKPAPDEDVTTVK